MTNVIRHDPYPVREPFHSIYTHGVEVPGNARTLYVSGQVGVSPDGTSLPSDFEGQCRQAITSLISVLNSADMDVPNIVKLGFYLTRPEDMEALVKIRMEMLQGVRPAITTVFVAGLVSPDWLVEVEAIAASAD
ncbi:MAG: RidA family protein [Sneathiella sp.]